MEKEKAKISPQQILMTAIPFSYEDLEANRDGYLTQRQRIRLNEARSGFKFVMIFALIACAVGAIVAIVNGVPRHDIPASHLEIESLVTIAMGSLAFYTWIKWRALNQDLHKGKVAMVEGVISVGYNYNYGNRTLSYMITIDRISLNVPTRVFFAFKNGDAYCLYYVPHSRTLLSAEWLREE